MKKLIFFFLLFCSSATLGSNTKYSDDVAREQVDLVELNHFYDEQGRLVFDQLIFYDWAERARLIPQFETRFGLDNAEAQKREGFEVLFDVKSIDQQFGVRYQVRAWRLVKNPNQIPQRDWENGGYSCFWQDGEQFRHIYAKAFRETWLQYDIELVEREYFPKEKRKELMTIEKRHQKKK